VAQASPTTAPTATAPPPPARRDDPPVGAIVAIGAGLGVTFLVILAGRKGRTAGP